MKDNLGNRVPPRAAAAVSTVWRGQPAPLGATWDGAGVNFALYSEHAERVELCLFDPKGRREVERIDVHRSDRLRLALLPARRAARRCVRLPSARPYDAERGHRFNPNKVLLDPYARMIKGQMRWRSQFWLPYRQSARGSLLRHARQRLGHAEEPGRGFRLHLGRRSCAAHRVGGHRDLRGARQRLDAAPSGRADRSSAALMPD